MRRPSWSLVLTVAVAAAVAVAFADSSIVVLALPELYADFDTTIVGVSLVITSYNLVVAVVALAIIPLVGRIRAEVVLSAGLIVFLGASIACAVADSLTWLIASRCVQGLGGALLLAGSLNVLVALTRSHRAGAHVWTLAGTFGAALGPALGGALTQAFNWRAIFVVQAPIAGVALLAAFGSHVRSPTLDPYSGPLRRTYPANAALALVFGALVGALFLAVLLFVTAWGYSPLGGAAIVSTLPAGAVLAHPLSTRLSSIMGAAGGALLLGLGLIGLALLPSSNVAYAGLSLLLCGFGLGLAVPPLTRAALRVESGLTRSGTLTIGARHLGLVVALVLIAPLLARDLEPAGERATLNATAVILEGEIPLTKKIPLALDMSEVFGQARRGEIPDLTGPFDKQGAATDESVADLRDDLIGTIEAAITRGFRNSFFLSALFALLALVPILVFRRRSVA